MRLCVITAMKDCATMVDFYRTMIDAFDHPPTRVVVSANDCVDDTVEQLHNWNRPGLDIAEVTLELPYRVRHDPDRAGRSARLAAARNCAIDQALAHTDWDIALMQDAAKYSPPDLPARLIQDGGDIVAPLVRCGVAPHLFCDTWCFRDIDGQPFFDEAPYTHKPAPRLQVEAVGGVYVIRRAVLEAGCRLEGTDGSCCDSVPLCRAAIAAGFDVYVRMDLAAYAFHDGVPQPVAGGATCQSI